MEQKRVLVQSLGFWRNKESHYCVAGELIELADANRRLGLYEEGIQQATEASGIPGPHGNTRRQAHCLVVLALLLCQDEQLDAAEETASRAMGLSESPLLLYHSHALLGNIHEARGNAEKALHHFETSLQIASSLGSGSPLSETHLSLAHLYAGEGKLNDALTHVEHAKSHAGNDMFLLGRVIYTSAYVLHVQRRFEEAKSEALCVLAVAEELGVAHLVEMTGKLLEEIEESL